MRFRFGAAAGVVTLAAAFTVPAGPAIADSTRSAQWYLKTLDVAQAQAITRGSSVTVAVVDSGAYPHPDLRRNLLPGRTVIAGESGSDGRTDHDGHGTNMAAIVAAHGRGDAGVLGVAPAAKILPVRVADTQAQGADADLGNGVEWAVRNGADVINVSAGAGPTPEIENAVVDALKADIVVVAAIGNKPESAISDYPAVMDGVLAVGATGRDGKHASFSLADPRVQICAPGDRIRTAMPESTYADSTGTSPAAAIVSGAAALVRAKFPRLSAREVIHRLTATADDVGAPGRDDECGYGELDIVKALTADVPPLVRSTASATANASSVGSGKDGYLDPRATTAAVTPEARPGSERILLVLGALAGLVVVGGAAGLFALQRRRRR
ncbi:S8 family serine peptidase [Actinoplanes subtropicus]|uniref:S8 family serine peptidase n=1 Tax=Actinoplanes subtropicus TaxID=543632 RepID=UPI0004C3A742|nr:S8 family serine peptidase [Actinoplanes subtropicus]